MEGVTKIGSSIAMNKTNIKQKGAEKRPLRSYVVNNSARTIADVTVLKRTRVHATSPASQPDEAPMSFVGNSTRINSTEHSSTLTPTPANADRSTNEHVDNFSTDTVTVDTITDASASIIVQPSGIAELSNKKVRGRTRGANADKVRNQLGGKLPITIVGEDEGRPTGPYAEMFASEIGFVIRNHAPLNIKKWNHVSSEVKESLIKRIQNSFDFDMKLPLMDRYVNKVLGTSFANFRFKLKNHFKNYPTMEEALKNRHKDVKTDEDWKFLCSYFSSEGFKSVSEKKSANRAKLKYHHKTGSRSFQSQQKHEVAKTGVPLDAIDSFEVHHKSSTKGWDVGAKELWEKMVQMRSETTQEDGVRTMTDKEICLKVLGAKSGYIKGSGFGPRPPSKYASVSSTQEMNEKNKALQEKLDETQTVVQAQAQEIIALKESTKKFEDFMAKFNLDDGAA